MRIRNTIFLTLFLLFSSHVTATEPAETHWTVSMEGLPKNIQRANLYLDYGDMYVSITAKDGGGLFRYESGRWYRLDTQGGTPNQNLGPIVSPADARFYTISEGRLFVLIETEWIPLKGPLSLRLADDFPLMAAGEGIFFPVLVGDTEVLLIYNIRTGAWRKVSNLPGKRLQSIAASKGKLYLSYLEAKDDKKNLGVVYEWTSTQFVDISEGLDLRLDSGECCAGFGGLFMAEDELYASTVNGIYKRIGSEWKRIRYDYTNRKLVRTKQGWLAFTTHEVKELFGTSELVLANRTNIEGCSPDFQSVGKNGVGIRFAVYTGCDKIQIAAIKPDDSSLLASLDFTPSLGAFIGTPQNKALTASTLDSYGNLILGLQTNEYFANMFPGEKKAKDLSNGKGRLVVYSQKNRSVAEAWELGDRIDEIVPYGDKWLVSGDFGLAIFSKNFERLLRYVEMDDRFNRLSATKDSVALLHGDDLVIFDKNLVQRRISSAKFARDIAQTSTHTILCGQEGTAPVIVSRNLKTTQYDWSWKGEGIGEIRKCSVETDGTLYAIGEMTEIKLSTIGGDPFHQSEAGPKQVIIVRLDLKSGKLLQAQSLILRDEVELTRMSNTDALDFTTDSKGRFYLLARSKQTIPNRDFITMGGKAIPRSKEKETFLLVLSKDFKRRLVWTTLGDSLPVMVRANGNKIAIAASTQSPLPGVTSNLDLKPDLYVGFFGLESQITENK